MHPISNAAKVVDPDVAQDDQKISFRQTIMDGLQDQILKISMCISSQIDMLKIKQARAPLHSVVQRLIIVFPRNRQSFADPVRRKDCLSSAAACF